MCLADQTTTKDATLLLQVLNAEPITMMQATPATWQMLLAAGWEGKSDLTILSGGEALPASLAKQLLRCGTDAPFDKIIITAAASMVPIDLIAQLKPLGVMVLPLGNEEQQTMTRLTTQVDGTLIEEKFENFVFVPMLKGKSDH